MFPLEYKQVPKAPGEKVIGKARISHVCSVNYQDAAVKVINKALDTPRIARIPPRCHSLQLSSLLKDWDD